MKKAEVVKKVAKSVAKNAKSLKEEFEECEGQGGCEEGGGC